MSPTVEPSLATKVRAVPSPRRGEPRRLRLALQVLAASLQVAWLTLVGWVGAFLALLPVALQGAPLGHRVARGPAREQLPALRRLGVGGLPGAGRPW